MTNNAKCASNGGELGVFANRFGKFGNDLIARVVDKVAKIAQIELMRNISAKDAKNQFGMLLDTARQEPVVIEKHGRPVAVICSVEAYDKLTAGNGQHDAPVRGDDDTAPR